MSVNEIFKKTFIEGFAGSEIDIKAIAGVMAAGLLLSIYVFFVYRVITRRSFYSQNFAISLVGVTLITAAIILTIQSNIVISLGTVGALSIVRFRTAIKDPMDLMFLFWAISNGIMCGAGLAEFALVLSAVLTIVVVILQFIPAVAASTIMVIKASNPEIEEEIITILRKNSSKPSVRARVISGEELTLTLEIHTKNDRKLTEIVSGINGVESVSILSHDGGVNY